MSSWDIARKVADAVLYEGYLLYPYRASAAKNQVRWQFGVLVPRSYSEFGTGEQWFSQTECLLEPGDESVLHLKLRWLQLQERRQGSSAWDEVVEQETDVSIVLHELLDRETLLGVDAPEGRSVEEPEAGRDQSMQTVRQRWRVWGALRVVAERLELPFPVAKLRVRVENTGSWSEAAGSRREALKHSMIAAHVFLQVSDGRFISLLDPPQWARSSTESCSNANTYPVMIGEQGSRDAMLSSPIILYDYPETAPESPGDLYDATEIDEILTLRTMALTDEEKEEARLTDPRAAAIIERTDALPPEIMEKLHGAIRYVGDTMKKAPAQPEAPWWDPEADASVSPESDEVVVGEVSVAKGSRVRLTPGSRRADAQDMFLVGRTARVEGVFLDVDDNHYLAVTLEDDLAADLHQSHGRFLYFSPDEVEPLEEPA
ncbi:MAG TPA: hypothetical protein VFS38_03075 [Actinomycetota bacterium]|nr:hypothetical protein [Actinomycetota bacterium]